MAIAGTDLQDLIYARRLLEAPGLARRLMNAIGAPVERGFEYLPEKWHSKIQVVSERALNRALDVALLTLDRRWPAGPSRDRMHKMAGIVSGGFGGFFGLAGLGFDLTVSTLIMLRSIADIARSEGENLDLVEARLTCLSVFAMGGPSQGDDSMETSYYATRAALSKAVTDAAEFLARRGAADRGAPILARLISQIASRFGIVVSEKAAAMAIPMIGAAGGAAINAIFIDHFQDIARGHFIVRRLERTYGKDVVKAQYDSP